MEVVNLIFNISDLIISIIIPIICTVIAIKFIGCKNLKKKSIYYRLRSLKGY